MLLTKTMKVVRYASMSKAGYGRVVEVLDDLVNVLSRLEPDIMSNDCCDGSEGDENHVIIVLLNLCSW
jgi:hypothetical protein